MAGAALGLSVFAVDADGNRHTTVYRPPAAGWAR